MTHRTLHFIETALSVDILDFVCDKEQEDEKGKFTKCEVIGPFFVVRTEQKQRAVCLLGEKLLRKR